MCGTQGGNQTVRNLHTGQKANDERPKLSATRTTEVRVGTGVPKTTTAASLRNYTNIRHAQRFDFGKAQSSVKPANNQKSANSYLNNPSAGSLVSKSQKPYSEVSGIRSAKSAIQGDQGTQGSMKSLLQSHKHQQQKLLTQKTISSKGAKIGNPKNL